MYYLKYLYFSVVQFGSSENKLNGFQLIHLIVFAMVTQFYGKLCPKQYASDICALLFHLEQLWIFFSSWLSVTILLKYGRYLVNTAMGHVASRKSINNYSYTRWQKRAVTRPCFVLFLSEGPSYQKSVCPIVCVKRCCVMFSRISCCYLNLQGDL